jgi:uncharacterized protein (TIGR00730 family)
MAAATELGQRLAEQGIGLVYGGSHVGLMGAMADACLGAGGEVIGVIPRSMQQREIAHTGLTQLHVVESMHERKALMAAFADAFLALPGGMGTWDELCEILTWAQLGIHAKPCAVLNTAGYFDPFRALLDHACSEGFVTETDRERLVFCRDVDSAVADLVGRSKGSPAR